MGFLPMIRTVSNDGWNTGFLIALSDVCASHVGESLLATAVPSLSPSQSEQSDEGTYFGLQDFHFKKP